jgi:hypothetical protein
MHHWTHSLARLGELLQNLYTSVITVKDGGQDTAYAHAGEAVNIIHRMFHAVDKSSCD